MSTKESDWSAEDDPETQETLANAATSEFRRLIERLKKEAELAKHQESENGNSVDRRNSNAS